MTLPVTTHAEFDDTSWHDNYIYALSISVGDINVGDWRSDLVFDIDHILQWICRTDGNAQFQVAPATLAFHDVTDLRVNIDWGDSGFQTAVHEASIDQITRARIAGQKICLDRPYYNWKIILNWPAGGEISFGSSGYTQSLRSKPVLQDQQKLSAAQRSPVNSPGI